MGGSRVEVWTDGSSLGNPGPGGYGAILSFTDAAGEEHLRELSGGFEETTNNRMELMAVICALEALTRPCAVLVHSDSSYVVKAHEEDWISGWRARGWRNSAKRPVANVDLWERLLAAEAPHEVSFTWVPGHAGEERNERCDALAKAAATGDDLAKDEGYLVTKSA